MKKPSGNQTGLRTHGFDQQRILCCLSVLTSYRRLPKPSKPQNPREENCGLRKNLFTSWKQHSLCFRF